MNAVEAPIYQKEHLCMDDYTVSCAILMSSAWEDVCNMTVQRENPIQESGWLLLKCNEGDLNYQYLRGVKCIQPQLSVFVLDFLFIHRYLEPMAGKQACVGLLCFRYLLICRCVSWAILPVDAHSLVLLLTPVCGVNVFSIMETVHNTTFIPWFTKEINYIGM